MHDVLILHSLPMTVYFSSSFLDRQKATLLNCVSAWIFLHDVLQSPLPVKHGMHIIFFWKISRWLGDDEWQPSEGINILTKRGHTAYTQLSLGISALREISLLALYNFWNF